MVSATVQLACMLINGIVIIQFSVHTCTGTYDGPDSLQ